MPVAAAAGIAYLHKNRERFTGYATQKEYDDARDLRILETRRADMLQRKEEGKSYSDKNLGDVTREIAKKKGLDILNPNEMRNIDKDIEEWGENYGFDDSGSFTGEGFGDSSGPSEDYGFDDSGGFTGEGWAQGGLTQRAPRKSMLKGGRVDKALGGRMDRPLTGRSRDI